MAEINFKNNLRIFNSQINQLYSDFLSANNFLKKGTNKDEVIEFISKKIESRNLSIIKIYNDIKNSDYFEPVLDKKFSIILNKLNEIKIGFYTDLENNFLIEKIENYIKAFFKLYKLTNKLFKKELK